MKHAFIVRKFASESLTMIEHINRILTEYDQQGFTLTLRQLYYQLVARDIIPNTVRSYKNIGNLVSDARQAGLIDWRMIEDRNRETVSVIHWDNPGDIVAAAARQFRIDKWEDQPWHVEVMVEKDALSGVLVPVCRELDIPLTANKGYSSSSTMYEIGRRIAYKRDRLGKEVLMIYLGDHDPSGIDMTRDVEERLTLFSEGEVKVVRIALNMDQVVLWQPPENPAKTTDSRYDNYVTQYGGSSWELDAVEPAQLASLIENIVEDYRDGSLWVEAEMKEEQMRHELNKFAASYKDGG